MPRIYIIDIDNGAKGCLATKVVHRVHSFYCYFLDSHFFFAVLNALPQTKPIILNPMEYG